MDDIRDLVIVGGGLAAAKAAEAARAAGFDRRVTIFTDEDVRPYERPPLSKDYLVGQATAEDVYVHSPNFYDEQDIRLELDTPVVEIDRTAGQVVTDGGSRHHFDRLLLATGAAPRRLPVSGADRAGVFLLRTLADSRRLGDALRAAGHVTVVGAGWIGCEVAAAARQLDTAVTMVDPLELPLLRVLGPQVGAVFRDLHAAQGVDLRLGVGVTGIDGDRDVESVRLADGSTVPTDLVVVGIGVTPRTLLAEHAGLDVDDGVVTDATLQASDPRIYAAGDVANAAHPWLGGRVRVEHWANALNQGTTAGNNLLGRGQAYDRVPYFYTDQYDLGMEYSGHATGQDEVVFRGDPATREFLAFWVRDGRVAAGMNVNIWDVTADIQALVRSQQPVDRHELADPDIPLTDLTGSG